MYSIIPGDTGNWVIVPQKEQHRWKFFLRTKNNRVPIKLELDGKNLWAYVEGEIWVFTKPHPATFQKEFMRQNGRAMFYGARGADHDRLAYNMLILERKIR
jgi:hypothetical protein